MKYSQFEILAVAGVALAVLVTVIVSDLPASEIIGQVLILLPLIGGLHFGRKGAAISFLSAVLAYGVVSLTMVKDSSAALQLFVLYTVIYGILALVAGELNIRGKYIVVRFKNRGFVDQLTSLYSGCYMAQLIGKHVDEFDHRGSRFSLGIINIDEDVLSPLKKPARNKRIKDIGNSIIKPGIRGSDEAGRLEGGKFLIMFPRTKKAGALTAMNRIRVKAGRYLEGQGLPTDDHQRIDIQTYEWPGDMEDIDKISDELS